MTRAKPRHIDDPASVGRRLRAARDAAGLTQRDLAVAGCTAAYVSRIESGARIPSLQLLRAFGELLLLFLAAPVAELIVTGGARGLARLASDGELRSSLLLTGLTATTATVLGVICGTPIAYLLSRADFRGRAILSAVLDLPLLIPHPVAGIALLLVLGRDSAVGSALLTAGLRVVGSPIRPARGRTCTSPMRHLTVLDFTQEF